MIPGGGAYKKQSIDVSLSLKTVRHILESIRNKKNYTVNQKIFIKLVYEPGFCPGGVYSLEENLEVT